MSGQLYNNNAKRNRIATLVQEGIPRKATGMAMAYQAATTQACPSTEKDERLNANNNSQEHTETARAMTP